VREIDLVISNSTAAPSPGNLSALQNPVLVIRHPTRSDTDFESLSYWIFAQYTHLARDSTIFISKVYDFFETSGKMPRQKCTTLICAAGFTFRLHRAALSRLWARGMQPERAANLALA